MEQTEHEKRVGKERRRLVRLLKTSGTSEEERKLLLPVIQNTAWMAVKLEDTAAEIGADSVSEEYDNGGGQKGTREDPRIRAYESLFRSYMAGMRTIIAAIPEEAKEKEEAKPERTVLELVREKHRNEGSTGTKVPG